MDAETMFRNMEKAREVIIQHSGGNREVSGAADCPVCSEESTLKYAVMHNGHVHAKCMTEKCVEWME